jgi:hypothetical protein
LRTNLMAFAQVKDLKIVHIQIVIAFYDVERNMNKN